MNYVIFKPLENWPKSAKIWNSVINMKCKALLWENEKMFQNESCFMILSYLSTFKPKRSHPNLLGPMVTRAPFVEVLIASELIKNSWLRNPRGCKNFFFVLGWKIMSFLTFSPIFRPIGQKLWKLYHFLDSTILIKLIMRNFFVLHYFRKEWTYEPIVLDLRLSH